MRINNDSRRLYQPTLVLLSIFARFCGEFFLSFSLFSLTPWKVCQARNSRLQVCVRVHGGLAFARTYAEHDSCDRVRSENVLSLHWKLKQPSRRIYCFSSIARTMNENEVCRQKASSCEPLNAFNRMRFAGDEVNMYLYCVLLQYEWSLRNLWLIVQRLSRRSCSQILV